MPAEVAGTSERRAIRLVVSRELREAFRRKSVWLTAAAFLVVSSAAMILPDLLAGDDDPDRTVLVVGEATPEFAATAQEAADVFGIELTLEPVTDADAASTRVEDDDGDAVLRLDVDPPVVIVPDEDDQLVVAVLRQTLQVAQTVSAAESAGLDRDRIVDILTVAPPTVEVLDTERGGRQAVAFFAAFAMYVLLLLLAIQVANAVAIEKSSRVSEVLLAIVPARVLLYGKVIGVGLIGLFTITAGAIPVVARLATGGSLPPGTSLTLATSIVFSVIGIALYLNLAGALGALVARVEDAGTAVGPITAVLILGYVIGQFAAGTTVGLVLALFPLTSPVVMPARVAVGEAGIVEVLIAAAVGVVAVVVAARFATTIYRRAIVRTSRKLTLREAIRLAE